MLRRATTRPWLCARCRPVRCRIFRRQLSIASSAAPRQNSRINVADHTAPRAHHDDKTLRDIFDSNDFWKDFSQSARTGINVPNVGLFQNRYLTSPGGFEVFANSNLRRAKRIVDRVLKASTVEEYRGITKEMDRLSDLLCRVIDLADFVRSTHPDVSMQSAANNAHSMMFEFMNILNTTTGLNTQLEKAMKNTDIFNKWTDEERVVARSLQRDFAKSAISLPSSVREKFVQLSQDIRDLGHEFTESPHTQTELTLPASKLKGMDPLLVRNYTKMKWGRTVIPIGGDVAVAALGSVEDEDVRRQIYLLGRTSSKQSVSLLDELLRKRGELAELTGYESYGHLTLGDKMAKSPEYVNKFLGALSNGNRPKVKQEMGELLKAKMKNELAAKPILLPWDKEYYMAQIKGSMRSTSRRPDFLSAYFSLGRVMQGLSRLFTRLYGIRFVPHETKHGETWNEDVRRLDVVSESDGHVAVLYCDLFSRPGKSPNPAHFTVRCSREILPHEVEEARSDSNSLFPSPEEATNDGMALYHSNGRLMQLPTIALICDFRAISQPSLLSFTEVKTLFHEMGHAIHSILGRTSLQEVSGTRCATDFAELPSILMESFAADPFVLALFASHFETNAPLPYELVAEKLAIERRFKAAEMEYQIILALLDQACHSTLALNSTFDSTTVAHEIQHQYGVLPPDPPGTSWQGHFGHIVGYGSTYYSYLFDTVLAARVWDVAFQSGKNGAALSRERGENMLRDVLRWGGGRDPWRCVADILGDGRLEIGGEEAMSFVGSWERDNIHRTRA